MIPRGVRAAIVGPLLAVAAAFVGAGPAAASLREDWAYTLERSRETAEQAARQAARQTERELRTRHIPPEAAPALAVTIRMTRDRARAAGVRRAPAGVVRALSPYFSPAVLEQVRWRPPMRGPSMSSLLVGWYFREGAVTLHDVVLFSNERLAQDPAFWAHELVHVEQYRRYGVEGFARRYVSDWPSLEAEATRRARQVIADMRTRRASGGPARRVSPARP